MKRYFLAFCGAFLLLFPIGVLILVGHNEKIDRFMTSCFDALESISNKKNSK